jgi:hypothetical protein
MRMHPHSFIFLIPCLLTLVLSSLSGADDLTKLPVTAEGINVSKLPIAFETDKSGKGIMFFYDKGWLSDARYPLKYFDGFWNWQTKDGKWHGLITPFITEANKYYYYILDKGGKIFASAKDNTNRYEIRLIEDTWCENAGGEWLPLYDYDE